MVFSSGFSTWLHGSLQELSSLQGQHLASLDEDVMALHLLLERFRLDAGGKLRYAKIWGKQWEKMCLKVEFFEPHNQGQ